MALKFKIDTLDSIPENQKSLYKKVDGGFQLDLDTEIKTDEDIKKLQDALVKERADHKEAKKKLSEYNKTPQEIQSMEDEMAELKIKANKIDEKSINDLVNVRVNPVIREKEKFQKELLESQSKVTTLESKLNEMALESSIRSVAEDKVHPLSVPDAILRAKSVMKLNPDDGKFYAPDGSSVEQWLEKELPKTNWGLQSTGAGAKGKTFTGGKSFEFNGKVFDAKNNPFSKSSLNLTEQSIIVKNNPEFAEELKRIAEQEK